MPELDWGVKVPISGILRFKGCFVAEIEAYALSCPDSADLYAVCLVAPREANKGIGPEIQPPLLARPGSLERVISDILWPEAESAATTDALAEAFADYDEARKEDAICSAHELRLGD